MPIVSHFNLNFNAECSVLESLSVETFDDMFSLCVHQYSEVRIMAQEAFHKIVGNLS